MSVKARAKDLWETEENRNKKKPFHLRRWEGFELWWRRGESNSGPYYLVRKALQA